MYKKAFALLLLMAAPAFAQTSQPVEDTQVDTEPKTETEDAEDKDFISLHAGLNLTSHYFARGIAQEDQGVIGQPWLELRMHLYQTNGPISDIYLFAKNWNSFHSGMTGTESPLSRSPAAWYETQFTAGLGVQVFRVLTVSGGYNVQISPNNRFDTIEELYVRGDAQDKRLWGLEGELGPVKWEFDGLRPYGLFAWETDGQRDAGLNRGVYAEVGAKPGVTLHPCEDFTALLSVPVSVGFNIFEYHEVQGKGDAPFAFFTVGFEGEVPLKWIPNRYGEWSLYGALTWFHLGQNVARFNGGQNDEIAASGGVRFNY